MPSPKSSLLQEMFIYFFVFISRRVDAGAELRGPDPDRAGVDAVEADDLEERDGDQTVRQVRSHSTIFTKEQSCIKISVNLR